MIKHLNGLIAPSNFQTLLTSKDWKNTQLGPIESWSTHLVFSINLMLQAKEPMIICWGEALYLFYNEACLKQGIIKDENKAYFGASLKTTNIPDALKNSISEAFYSKKSQTLSPFEMIHFENQKTYYRFNATPLFTDANMVSGLMIKAEDQTELVISKKQTEHLIYRFNNTIKQAPIGVLILSGTTHTVEVINSKYKQLLPNKSDDLIGAHIDDVLPDCSLDLKSAILDVLKTGLSFQATDIAIKNTYYAKHTTRFFNFLGEAIRNENQDIIGVILAVTEVTDSIQANQKIAESEYKFRNVILQSPIPIAVFEGPNHLIKMANNTMIKDIWNRKKEELINKPLLDAFPELKGQKYPELLDRVFKTGKPYSEKESLAIINTDNGSREFYFDFDYSPIFESDKRISGIIATAVDVTEKVASRKKIEIAETRLRIATEASKLTTWELDLKTSKIMHSSRMATILGYPKTKILEHDTIRSHVNKTDLEHILTPAFNKALKTGTYFYEVRAYKIDGSKIWVQTQGKVFYDDQGKPSKMIGTLRDMTMERNNQQRLVESEQKFRLLADSMPQKIWIADPQGNVNYFNKAVYTYSGLCPEQFNTEYWIEIVHPDDKAENVKRWKESIENGTDYIFEHRFKRHDGQYRWQLTRAIPQRDDKGTIKRWVGTSTDIQDQKMFLKELERQVNDRTKLLARSNEKLENSVKELQRMNEELQSFAYISSHDLQEPLRKIQIFSSRILESEKDNLSTTGQGYFNRMQKAAHRMQALIKDLLAYSRTNTSVRTFEKTDLNTILNEVKIDLKELLQEKNVTLEVKDLCTAYIIPFQFIQLFSNLITNSIKFAKKDVDPIIKIESVIDRGETFKINQLKLDAEYCHIKVSDNGIGFDAKYSEQIFEVFERLHNRTTYEGTGIGLAIVKKIVENHDGMIFADGVENQGVTFNIYIPTDKSMYN